MLSDVLAPRSLDELFREYEHPTRIRSNNGPERVSNHVQKWRKEMHVDTHYIEPDSLWQNAYNESFN